MDLAPVIEALQATLAPPMRKQAEDKLAEVHFICLNLTGHNHFFI